MIYVDTVDSATAGLTQAGTVGFIYSISTDSNCSTTDTIELIVHSLPNVTAGADPNVCAGQQFQLTVTGGALIVSMDSDHWAGESFKRYNKWNHRSRTGLLRSWNGCQWMCEFR